MTCTMTLGGLTLGPDAPPTIVAEIGVNHDGDLDVARRTIDAAAAAGADAVKFQTFRTEEFMADRRLRYRYRTAAGEASETMFEMFKRLELPTSWHAALRDHAAARDVEFLSSAADPSSADLLVELGVPAIKLSSEDLINLPLLEHVAGLGLPVILSTGMADEREIDDAVAALGGQGCELLLLHCVSMYPTPDDQANLRRMTALARRYGRPVGLSDHTRGDTASVAATALGAVMIEKHFTLDRARPGPDHEFSIDPAGLRDLVRSVRRTWAQLGSADLAPAAGERESRRQFRRSVVAAVEIKTGATLTREMLHLKRPGSGIPPRELARLVGRRVRRPIGVDEPLDWAAVE
jgi:sialic acid synthase SpsE